MPLDDAFAHRWPTCFRLAALALSAGCTASFASAAEPFVESFQREIRPILDKYCYDCHGNGHKKGGVTLDEFPDAAALRNPDLWLRVLKNVRAGVMPPADEHHPLPAAEVSKLSEWIKRDAFQLDPAKPDPGRVTVRRLNRVEYRNTIKELLGVDYDTQKEFPADDTGHGFDNIADVLTISPMLLERYFDAAQAIVTKGVVTKPRTVAEHPLIGKKFETIKVDTTIPEQPKPPAPPADPIATLASATPPAGAPRAPGTTPTTVAANPNAPAGTPAAVAAAQKRGQGRFGQGRGRTPPPPPPVTRPVPTADGDALVLSYYTPAVVATKHRVDKAGKYQVVIDMIAQETYADNLFDLNKCQFVFTVDGEKLLEQEFVREGYAKKFEFAFDRDWAAGEHEITIEIKPIAPEAPQYRRLRFKLNAVVVRGPLAPEFWVKTPGYDKYFPRDVPAGAEERRAYAREILAKFASRAFRRPAAESTVDRLVKLAEFVYSQPQNTFEAGVAQAMIAAIASPPFIFREEFTEPLRAGETHPRLDEYSLASRLSYFLWSSMPDDELLRLAGEGKLRANLPAQVRRMLADTRAREFVRNFTGQWLQARDIATVPITAQEVFLRDHPNPALDEARAIIAKLQGKPSSERTEEEQAAMMKARTATFEFFRQPKPDLTDSLRTAMRQETELTFGHVLHEDRSVLELIKSDYTFLNEALAKHYGIADVTGNEMRKVTLPFDSPRGGVLTQGTVLTVTSNPNRTSPVKRGVFILEAILGMPPAPPPPNIPSLEDAAPAEELKKMNLRDTLALHAKNPLCASCHLRMDPIGLALENFNAMGVWRTADMNQPVEPAGKLVTGESFKDVRELKHVLATARRLDFYRCLSEKLLTYALGRSVEYYDTVTLDRLVQELEASGGRPSALLNGIINSAAFQQRRQPAAAAVGDATAPKPRSAE